jgi:hypothetical protein
MRDGFPLDYGKIDDLDADIVLRDAETKRTWGTLTWSQNVQHWHLEKGEITIDTLTGDRDSAFFFSCGFMLGEKNV